MDGKATTTKRLRQGSLVTVFGGSGFVGRHLVQALARRGYWVRVAVRRPNAALFLRPMGDVGQVTPFPATVRDERSIAAAVDGADAVINLVGVLKSSGKQTFEALQAKAPGDVARLAHAAGVERLVQMSAIGAASDSASEYARTKAAGEKAVFERFPDASVVRPSIVFGPEDDFFNRFASMATMSPFLPLIGGGKTQFQPVYVKDVAEAIVRVMEGGETTGRVFELGGPEVHDFKSLMQMMLQILGRRRLLVSLPYSVAGALGSVAQLVPGAPITADQVRLLREDNVVSAEAQSEGRTLQGLDIHPTALKAVLPSYLYMYRRGGQFAHPPHDLPDPHAA